MNGIHRANPLPGVFVASLLLAAILLAVAAQARAGPQLELTMSSAVQILTRNERGEESVSYESRETAQPGERMLYTIRYHNAGDAAARAASLVGAIPANASFVEVVEAGSGVEVRFSSDGAKNFSFLPFTFVTTDAEGKTVTRDAGADNFTHLRFTLTTPIEPGASGQVSYLVRIR